ncbi:MAG: 30S ribosomal protein S8 [Candidatus Micrarchaeota archaeon]
MDTLAQALTSIKMAETRGKNNVAIKPASNLVKETLTILQAEGYIGEFERVDDGKSGSFKIKLAGRINNCGIIRPRFSVKAGEWEDYEERFLPARGVGILVVSTSNGVMTHKAAKERKIGGRLLCFAY